MKQVLPKAQLKIRAVLIALVICCMPLTATAALPGAMRVQGETQGIITNNPTTGLIEIIEFGHSLSQAIDPVTGIPAGVKQHRAVRVTKAVDLATPKLMTALTTGEKLPSVQIRFFRPDENGQEEFVYEVVLLNAYIASISQSSRTYGSDDWTSVMPVPTNETLTFSYETIRWRWRIDGESTSQDDWDQAK